MHNTQTVRACVLLNSTLHHSEFTVGGEAVALTQSVHIQIGDVKSEDGRNEWLAKNCALRSAADFAAAHKFSRASCGVSGLCNLRCQDAGKEFGVGEGDAAR